MQDKPTLKSPKSQASKFLISLWRPKYRTNLLRDSYFNPCNFLVAIQDQEVRDTLRIENREEIFSKVPGFIETNKNSNIFYSPQDFQLGYVQEREGKGWAEDNIYHVLALTVDLDFYKDLELPEDIRGWIYKRMAQFKLPKPHYITKSSDLGRQLTWILFKEEIGKLTNTKLLKNFKLVREKINAHVFHPYSEGTSPVQLFRLPGSNNVKRKKPERVVTEQVADTEAHYSFYQDFVNPLWDVKTYRPEIELNAKPRHPAKKDGMFTDKTKIELQSKGDGNPYGNPVGKWYREAKPDREARGRSNDWPVSFGYVLYLKGFGWDQEEIKKELLNWSEKMTPGVVNCLLRSAFTGDNLGEGKGKGWKPTIAAEYMPFTVEELNEVIPLFKEPVIQVEDTPERKYMNREERFRRIQRALLLLKAYKDAVSMPIRALAEKAGVKYGTLLTDIKEDRIPFIKINTQNGLPTVWTLLLNPLHIWITLTFIKYIKDKYSVPLLGYLLNTVEGSEKFLPEI